MRRFRLVAPFVVTMLVVAACSSDDNASPAAGGSGGEGELGGTISILAVYADAEQESFMAMIQPWADEHGVEIQYSSTRDINAQLTTQIAGGNPPDIAGLPGPGPMAQFARDGDLVPLTDVIDMDTYAAQYDSGWIKAGTVDDQLVGIFTKVAVKGLIFYNPAAFEAAGYTAPEDFDGLTALVDQISADGTPPWGIGLESGAASGWPGTDWIEDFVVRQGPDVYDQWVAGELPWTSPEITAAFEAFGAGRRRRVRSRWSAAVDQRRTSATAAIASSAIRRATCTIRRASSPGSSRTTSRTWPWPARHTTSSRCRASTFEGVTTAGDLFGMFNDTPRRGR